MAQYSYSLADPDTAANGTGTLAVTISTTAVVGSSTAFDTQLVVGDVIIFGGYAYAVAVITDPTHLTLATAAKTTETTANFTFTALTNVENMATKVTPPKSNYRPYTDSVKLANGKVRGLGRPIATWRWGFITLAQRTQLRVYCNNAKSDAVYLRTRTNEADAYQTFTASIVWPDDEDKQAGRRVNFTLEFKNLVQL